MCCCICQTEVEVNILKFLESCVVYEGEDVHFECLLSHEETPLVQWKLQDVPLQNNEMNLIKAEGRVHSLTLRGVTTADSGTVTFTVGNHTSTASLTVRGEGGITHFISWDEKGYFPFASSLTFGLLLIYSTVFLVEHILVAISKSSSKHNCTFFSHCTSTSFTFMLLQYL